MQGFGTVSKDGQGRRHGLKCPERASAQNRNIMFLTHNLHNLQATSALDATDTAITSGDGG